MILLKFRRLMPLQIFVLRSFVFSDDVSSSLTSLQMEVQRSQEWINHDRPNYWKTNAA